MNNPMSLLENIVEAQKKAMKEKDADTLSTLRMLTAAVKNEQIDAGKELDDEAVQDVIRRQVKQLNDAKKDFETGGRSDLIEKTEQEIAVLAAYLPVQLSEEEIRIRVTEMFAGKEDLQMGPAIGMAMAELKGIADGNIVRKIVGEILQQ